jgi:hypothetical protein
MNERIKELALQAGDYVNEVYTPPVRSKTPGKIWEDGHIDWLTQFNEKFAQLIVKECMDIARNVGNISEPDDWALDRCYEIEQRIQDRFGVEE